MNGLTWILKLSLPDRDVTLSDAGVSTWNGDTYRNRDENIGALVSVAAIQEGLGQEIPSLEVAIAPPDSAAMTELTVGCFRQSPVRLYLAEYDIETAAVVYAELRFAGNMDTVRVSYALRESGIVINCTPELETLFFKDTGNGLSSTFHKQLYPGETGHDQATGLMKTVYWGLAGPTGSATPGGGAGNGGGNIFTENRVDFQ
jgi:hypothetical protein